MSIKQPLTFVLFGATGDLAQKKIIPALLRLSLHNKIPDTSRIIAFSRRPWSDDEYRTFITPALKDIEGISEAQKKTFVDQITYVQGTFDDDTGYQTLKEKVDTEHVLFHLAVQPEFYEIIFRKLGEAGFGNKDNLKLLIEKPFGSNYLDAQHVQSVLREYFTEEQTYRIDHYLAKGGLMKILKERKENRAFESRLDNAHVESLHLSLLETSGIEGRGEFYDSVGALRDVGQNHLLEMLAVTTMDLPPDDSRIPQARAEVMDAIKPITALLQLIRGQYVGYTDDKEVKKHSQTETYFHVVTEINTPRWVGVPVRIEGGKALLEKRAEVKIIFKDGKEQVFHMEGGNQNAYELLIEKAVHGDKQFFVSIDEVLASWKFVDPIVELFKEVPLKIYQRGADSV
jgi:glucose-6-phosphate 1-dehydrogenase